MNSKIKNISIQNNLSIIQTGSIPTGITSVNSKYPIHAANTSIDNPNFINGPTQTPNVLLNRITKDFSIGISGDWIGKIRSGDAIQLKRGTIKSDYLVKDIKLENSTSIITFDTRRENTPLTAYIGASGYPYPSSETYVSFNRKIESPNTIINKIKSFNVQMIRDTDTDFSIYTNWKLEPSISAIKLRWRSVPKNITVSSLGFSMDSIGDYTEFPDFSIISDSGSSANIRLLSSIVSASIDSGGTGYTYSPTVVFNGGGGTGASAVANVAGGLVTGLSFSSGGTGYTSIPTISLIGASGGIGASAHVSRIQIYNFDFIQQGGGYLEAPTVVIDSQYLTGSTGAEITSSLSLNNNGRVAHVKIDNGGYGYTGASVTISGNAIISATLTNGSISSINVIDPGYGYTGASVTIMSYGTGGTGAAATAVIDMYSDWNYVNTNIAEPKTIAGFKYNILYEIEILASEDESFKGLIKYTNSTQFEYYK